MTTAVKRPIKLSLHEFAGSMGDFGTLLPLAIGYIVVCGLDPAGFLVMMGLANIVTGLVYRLPIPIEPMKVIAVVAIAQHWSPSMVHAAGLSMGIVWLLLAGTGVITWVARNTPTPVVMGIQVTLGLMLATEALRLSSNSWLLAVLGVVIVLTLRKNRYAPASIVLMGLGIGIMVFAGGFDGLAPVQFRLPQVPSFTLAEMWDSLLRAGFAQIPLTAANAVIATSALITSYWPEEKVAPRKLAFSHGVMNVISPIFGGMPMCHGAGGLVGQYFYGARTAGANIIEGVIEIVLGLLFAGSIVGLFSAFPSAIVGAMMFMVGIELVKFARHVKLGPDLITLAVTVVTGLLANMAVGFIVGVVAYKLVERATASSGEGGH
ncbi:MAG: putative sulfate/molybdate transporter [Coriobacteriia bacterium]|nr:putative sulfate/molybdate transporter [Coriobacteriia bacterium]